MYLLNIGGRFLNLDLVIEIRNHGDGSITVFFAAPGPEHSYSSCFEGSEAAALLRWANSNSTTLLIDLVDEREEPVPQNIPNQPFLG